MVGNDLEKNVTDEGIGAGASKGRPVVAGDLELKIKRTCDWLGFKLVKIYRPETGRVRVLFEYGKNSYWAVQASVGPGLGAHLGYEVIHALKNKKATFQVDLGQGEA